MAYKTIALKNGETAVLSWLCEADLPDVLPAVNSVIREDKYLLIVHEITNLDAECQWFKEAATSGMQYVVARVDGKVVGGASLEPHNGKRSHIAEFGIYIIKKYRDLGLGTALTTEFVEIARKGGFQIVQLSAFATNKRAIHVYQKCGFKKCGKLTRDIKFRDGTYADRIFMEQVLST